jgi:hypothetical protein
MNILQKLHIEVGLWGNETYPDGQKVVDVAKNNILGTDSIPARDFMTIAKENIRNNCIQKLKKIIIDSHKKGGLRSVESAVERIAIDMQSEVKQAILDMDSPSNAPSTVRQKGFNDPLIETKTMLNSVAYRFETKTGKM